MTSITDSGWPVTVLPTLNCFWRLGWLPSREARQQPPHYRSKMHTAAVCPRARSQRRSPRTARNDAQHSQTENGHTGAKNG